MLRRLLPFAAIGAAALACAEPPPEQRPDVVLVSIESLRVDHLGAYGGASPVRPELPVMPALDAFAGEGTVYTDAHAVTSWTLAAHASLFTGLYPSAHQTDGPLDTLAPQYQTLAEVLADRGYQTLGVVSGPYLRRTHGLDQGFQHYDDSLSSITSELAHADVTNPGMEAALRGAIRERRDPTRPLFLFAYFWDPHFDFLPPPPYDSLFLPPGAEPVSMRDFDTNPEIHAAMADAQRAYLQAQYSGELRWTDLHLERLFALLREAGIWDDALIVAVADHGEEFFDHGEKGHKNNLYAETVRVPLIVKYPGQQAGRREARLASQVDLLPTVLELLGAEPSAALQGRSLLGAAAAPERALLYELRSIWYALRPDGRLDARETRWEGLRRGRYKLLRRQRAGEPVHRELYEVAGDPGEQRDLAADEPERVAALAAALDAELAAARAFAAAYPKGAPAELTAAELEALRALGYLPPEPASR